MSERRSPTAVLLKLLGFAVLALALLAMAFRAPDRSLESLVARWAPPPSEFIELALPGGSTQLVHLRDQGPRSERPPLVLLHGTAASLHTWEGWVRQLSREHRVISVDLPGFGLTGPSASGDYRDAAYVDFVAALLDRLKLGPVVIGGNSLGGQIAWQFAARWPGRVRGLVLVDAGGLMFQSDSVPPGFQVARSPWLQTLAGSFLPRPLVQRSVQSVFGDPSRVSAALVDRYFELTLREGNRQALIQRLAQLEPGRHADELDRLRTPTLILWGEQDRLIPPALAEEFKRRIAGSQLTVFPGLGHVPQEEDPESTVRPVLAFLNSLKP